MKRFLGKRWHRIPVALVSVLLVIALMSSGALAAYNFFTATAEVEVGEPFTFGVNYVGWDAPPDADMIAGYYSQSSPLAFSVTLKAGEVSHGNPSVPEEVRDLLPLLVIDGTDHTFNSMQVANDGLLPITVSFAVTGESEDACMMVWESPDLYCPLDGYTTEVPGSGFIMRGIGVVVDGGAEPIPYSLTVTVTRG